MFKVRKCVFQSYKCQKFHFWHHIGFPEPKNLILGAIKSLNVTLAKISHDMSCSNGFTTSSAYKVGLNSPILAERPQNIAIFCVKFQIPQIQISYNQNASCGPFGHICITYIMKISQLIALKSETGLKQLILAKNAPNLGFLEENLSIRPQNYIYHSSSITSRSLALFLPLSMRCLRLINLLAFLMESFI